MEKNRKEEESRVSNRTDSSVLVLILEAMKIYTKVLKVWALK